MKLEDLKVYYLTDKLDYKQFDDLSKLSDRDYRTYEAKAKKLFNAVSYEDYDAEACFISSNDLHGFYFPNLNAVSNPRAIAFINGEAVIILEENAIISLNDKSEEELLEEYLFNKGIIDICFNINDKYLSLDTYLLDDLSNFLNSDDFADFIAYELLGDYSRNITVLSDEEQQDKDIKALFYYLDLHF